MPAVRPSRLLAPGSASSAPCRALPSQLGGQVDLLLRRVDGLEALHAAGVERADDVPVAQEAKMVGDADGLLPVP